MINKWIIGILLVIACFLLFYNLGDGFLWFDESSIAAMGENVLKFGYPQGIYNGTPIWSHYGYRAGHAYISRPWLEIYVAAFGRFIFGKTNFAVRIFFTFFGYLSLVFSYFLSRRLFKRDETIPVFSLLLLATSVPFLLQMRQCAYYSLVTFATLWICWSYLDLLENKKRSFLMFLAASFFFLLSNHGIFLMVFLGCLLHYILFSRRKEIKKHVSLTTILLCLAFLFIAWYFKAFTHIGTPNLLQIYPNISYYIRTINKHVLPYRFYLVILAILVVFKHKKIIGWVKIEKNNLEHFYLFACIFLISLVFLAFERHQYFRYIINLVPLLVIIHAYIISRLFKWKKVFGSIILILIIFTNIINYSWTYLILKPVMPLLKTVFHMKQSSIDKIDRKGEVKTYFPDYLYEITHKYEGPIGGIVTYLNKNAKPGDSFKTPYNVIGIMYYTGLDGSRDFSSETYPEWIIFRKDWTSIGFYESRYGKKILERYKPITLTAIDIPWENRPDDLGYHKFKTVKEGPPVVIYKRRD